MTIIPLRNLVLVQLQESKQTGRIIQVSDDRTARPAKVMAVGPEVRDVKLGDVAIVNTVTGTVIGDHLLVPETAVLGVL